MPLTLVLPLPPNLANARMHWARKHRERKAYFAQCDARQALVLPAPPPEPMPFASVWAQLTMPSRMDVDNAMARLKWPIDWLVTRGYLAGDSPKHIEWRGLPVQQITRRFDPVVTIVLHPNTTGPR